MPRINQAQTSSSRAPGDCAVKLVVPMRKNIMLEKMMLKINDPIATPPK